MSRSRWTRSMWAWSRTTMLAPARTDPGFGPGLLRSQVRANLSYLTHLAQQYPAVDLRTFDLPHIFRLIVTDRGAHLTFYGEHAPPGGTRPACSCGPTVHCTRRSWACSNSPGPSGHRTAEPARAECEPSRARSGADSFSVFRAPGPAPPGSVRVPGHERSGRVDSALMSANTGL